MKTKGFVICVDNSEYPALLELHKIYRVIPDKEAQAVVRALNKSLTRTPAQP